MALFNTKGVADQTHERNRGRFYELVSVTFIRAICWQKQDLIEKWVQRFRRPFFRLQKNVSIIRIIMFLRNKSTQRKKSYFIVYELTDILNALSEVEYSSIDKNENSTHVTICLSGRGVAIISTASNVMCSGFPTTEIDMFCSMIIQS